MSTGELACTDITIEKSVEQIDTVSAVLAAIGGLILGLIIGFLLIYFHRKCCFDESSANKTVTNERGKEELKLHSNEHVNYFPVYKSKSTGFHKKRKHKATGKIHPANTRSQNKPAINYIKKTDHKVPVLSQIFLSCLQNGQQSAYSELAQMELYLLQETEVDMWRSRVWCGQKLPGIILLSLVRQNVIEEDVRNKICVTQEKASKEMNNHLQKFVAAYKFTFEKLISNYSEFQANYLKLLEELTTSYFGCWQLFKAQLQNLMHEDVFAQVSAEISGKIVLIENELGKLVDGDNIKKIFNTFHVFVQEFQVVEMTVKSEKDYFGLRQNMVLERLVKAGRISSQTKDDISREIADKRDAVHENNVTDIVNRLREYLNDKLLTFNKYVNGLDDKANQSLKLNSTDFSGKSNIDEIIKNFLQIRNQQIDQKFDFILKSAVEELNQLNELVSLYTQIHDDKITKQIEDYCEILFKNDCLDRDEVENMEQELKKDVQNNKLNASKNIKTCAYHLWLKFDENFQATNENRNIVAMVTLNDLLAKDMFYVKNFLELLTVFPDEQIENIMNYREVSLVQLGNLLNLNRGFITRTFELDLAKCQWVLLAEKREALATNKIKNLENILEKLWKGRNGMLKYRNDVLLSSSMSSIIAFTERILSTSIAHEIIRSRQPEKITVLSQKQQIEEVSSNLLEKIEITSDDLKSKLSYLAQQHQLECKKVTVPQVENFKRQVEEIVQENKAKEMLIREKLNEIKNSNSSQNISTSVDKMMLSHQIDMDIDDVSKFAIPWRHSSILHLKKSYADTVQNINEAMKKQHMCRVAAECGVSKKLFKELVKRGIENAYATQQSKLIVAEFMRFWKSSLVKV